MKKKTKSMREDKQDLVMLAMLDSPKYGALN